MCLFRNILFSANKEAETKGEKQTPVHYAAKNDATKSLKLLIKRGCMFDKVVDYRGRTPLFVASQLGRSKCDSSIWCKMKNKS